MKNAGRVPPPPYYPNFGEGKATGGMDTTKHPRARTREKSEVRSKNGTAVAGKNQRVAHGTAQSQGGGCITF